MKRRSLGLRRAVVLAVALGLVALGTGVAGAVAPAAKADKKLKLATLNASGATFPLAFYQETIAAFKKVQPAITINYAAGGSGKGRTDFVGGVVDYAGSDAPYKPTDPQPPEPFFYIPTVAGPITVAYNLPAVKGLRLSGPTIAKIFQAQIETWNDPAIKAENPKAKLPSTKITVARRSDGSGTTENFTKFLVAAAPGVWTLGSGATVAWPSSTQGGNGNGGVASIVQDTPGAIGYVDYSDARAVGLTFASVKNQAGKYVAPSVQGATAALAGSTLDANLLYNPIYAPGAKAYPITAPTWLLVYQQQADAAKGAGLVAYLNYLLGKGQQVAGEVDFAKLPRSFVKQARAQVKKIQVPSS